MLYLFELLYVYLHLIDFLKCRAICREWYENVMFIAQNSRIIPNTCDYLNVGGLLQIFPNIVNFKNIGHRGRIFERKILERIQKIWLDSSIHSFSILCFSQSFYNISNLIVNVTTESFMLLNLISRIEWINLNNFCIISDNNFENSFSPSFWNMPNLKSIMLGNNCSIFPLYLRLLPINKISELCVINAEEKMNISFSKWFKNFVSVWKFINVSMKLQTIRLYYVVPDTPLCITTLIHGLKSSYIHVIHLVPCSLQSATAILTNTSFINLYTRPNNISYRWRHLKEYLFPHRLDFI